MLQHLYRITPQVADSITGVHPSIHALVQGFKSGGTDILEDLPVCSCGGSRGVNDVVENDADGGDFVEEVGTCTFEETL